MKTEKTSTVVSIYRALRPKREADPFRVDDETIVTEYLESGEEKILENSVELFNASYGKVLLLLRHSLKKGYYIEIFDRNQDRVLACPIKKEQKYTLKSRFQWTQPYGEEEIFSLIPISHFSSDK